MAAAIEVSAKCRRQLADGLMERLGVSKAAADLYAIRADLTISPEIYVQRPDKVRHLLMLTSEFVSKAILALEEQDFGLDRETLLANMQPAKLSV